MRTTAATLAFGLSSAFAQSSPVLQPAAAPEQGGKLPADFAWGTATAAYQIEGGWNADGRGPSLWDYFSHRYPNNVNGGKNVTYDFKTGLGGGSDYLEHNADEADLSYYYWKNDIDLIKKLGAPSYRFSMSWTRLFPDGHARRAADGKWNVNPKGLKYYDSLVNALIEADITPFVTMVHWDLPMNLHSEYGGWLGYQMQDDFKNYAHFLFEHFGDRVKHWITFNEPWVSCFLGFQINSKAPWRYGPPNNATEDPLSGPSYEIGPTQYTPESKVLPANRPQQPLEALWCSHNLLNAHAKAQQVYRTHFAAQNALVGLTVDGEMSVPWQEPNTTAEQLASNTHYADLANIFRISWYADPLVYGDYPPEIKERVGSDMPVFTEEQKALLKGSVDFLGWNAYTGHWAEQARSANGSYIPPSTTKSYATAQVDIWHDNCRGRDASYNCLPPRIGAQGGSSWLIKYPKAIRVGLNWLWNRYSGNIPHGLYITENGASQPNAKVAAPNDTVTADFWAALGENPADYLYGPDEIESEFNVTSLVDDTFRQKFFADYLEQVRLTVTVDGIPLKGYFAWSLMDNFEWEDGYTTRFGMSYVNFTDPERVRHPKGTFSAVSSWFAANKAYGSKAPIPTIASPSAPAVLAASVGAASGAAHVAASVASAFLVLATAATLA
ncbi:putative cellulase [Blyttiomyces helicus]|uniref:beta-glucosidase n=1 Tax=Blyttiomyces helicus TaxID=388810 RepID=A0A4P9W3J3_9FUNG|nr:putative cellulase [Blyttiomyces helicus]|eukprot:RKO86704.1 putative cellulase [Blyttiomyces helicus]